MSRAKSSDGWTACLGLPMSSYGESTPCRDALTGAHKPFWRRRSAGSSQVSCDGDRFILLAVAMQLASGGLRQCAERAQLLASASCLAQPRVDYWAVLPGELLRFLCVP